MASSVARISLAALYLRGAPRSASLPRSRWLVVDSCVRRRQPSLGDVPAALRKDGLWAEALALEEPSLLAWAEALVARGEVLTTACAAYPEAWLRRLGASAPPALWMRGTPQPASFIAIVGSRSVPPGVLACASAVASEAVRLGFGVVSGAAAGCDRAAAKGARLSAGALLEILPHGISHARSPGCSLSLCEPHETFSGAAAMERNALIYSAARAAVLVSSRFREGGTWQGATDALRRRRCPVLVSPHGSELAVRALVGLGAVPLPDPRLLGEAMDAPGAQPRLLDACASTIPIDEGSRCG